MDRVTCTACGIEDNENMMAKLPSGKYVCYACIADDEGLKDEPEATKEAGKDCPATGCETCPDEQCKALLKEANAVDMTGAIEEVAAMLYPPPVGITAQPTLPGVDTGRAVQTSMLAEWGTAPGTGGRKVGLIDPAPYLKKVTALPGQQVMV
jgi:hypothetical protein